MINSISAKKYRFFYHYHKQKKEMTVHFKNQCIPTKNVECLVPCETKWSKRQPQLVMRGFASHVKITDDKVTIG